MAYAGKFLHIAFFWSGLPKTEELKPVFDEAADWMRYAPNCWIIWTGLDVTTWHNKLIKHLAPADRMFICEVNVANKQGWMEKWAWEWLNKFRTDPPFGK